MGISASRVSAHTRVYHQEFVGDGDGKAILRPFSGLLLVLQYSICHSEGRLIGTFSVIHSICFREGSASRKINVAALGTDLVV